LNYKNNGSENGEEVCFFSWLKQYKRGGNFTERCKGYSRCDLVRKEKIPEENAT